MYDVLFAVGIVAAIGFIAGLGLSVCSVIMAVKSDEKVEALRAELPGANCGACGYSGCDGYAEALAKGEAKPGACAPGGADVNEKLGAILGVSVEMAEPKAAYVLCGGDCHKTDSKMFYNGIKTCKAANMLYSGPGKCSYGCIGYGDCAAACQYGAVSVKNGKATVDRSLCTACGACVKACPKGIIELLPVKTAATVQCSNKDKGAAARKVCSVSCIGCGICAKNCEFGAITVENNLARIDPEKCTGCGKCVEKCPQNCIVI